MRNCYNRWSDSLKYLLKQEIETPYILYRTDGQTKAFYHQEVIIHYNYCYDKTGLISTKFFRTKEEAVKTLEKKVAELEKDLSKVMKGKHDDLSLFLSNHNSLEDLLNSSIDISDIRGMFSRFEKARKIHKELVLQKHMLDLALAG